MAFLGISKDPSMDMFAILGDNFYDQTGLGNGFTFPKQKSALHRIEVNWPRPSLISCHQR